MVQQHRHLQVVRQSVHCGAHRDEQFILRGLGQADLTHPTSVGAEIIGNWIYQALIKDYQTYLAEASVAP